MAHITQSLTWQTLSLHFAIKQTGAEVSVSILLSRIGPFREDGLTRVPECRVFGQGFQRMTLMPSSGVGAWMLPGWWKGLGSNCSIKTLLTNPLFVSPTQHPRLFELLGAPHSRGWVLGKTSLPLSSPQGGLGVQLCWVCQVHGHYSIHFPVFKKLIPAFS